MEHPLRFEFSASAKHNALVRLAGYTAGASHKCSRATHGCERQKNSEEHHGRLLVYSLRSDPHESVVQTARTRQDWR